MFRRISKVKEMGNERFFSGCPSYINKMGVYVWGDAIFFLPFHIIIFIYSFFSLRFALLVWAIFFSIRSLGEIVYWLFQQFSDRSYRPYDFGFKNLDNNAIYILYQTMMTVNATVSVTAAVIFVMYWSVLPTSYVELVEIVRHLLHF